MTGSGIRSPRLSDKLAKAFQFAQIAHGRQVRKGTAIPYLSHPMAVSAITLEHGGTEDQASAALLHDTVEDCGVTYQQISRRFGHVVARIVRDCTDAETIPKPPWKERKVRYIEHLERSDARSLLVSAADKLHNARAIVTDVKRDGNKVWKRFNASPAEILWYYESLHRVFRKRRAEGGGAFKRLTSELGAIVAEMRALPH